jgi:hypothetical protein
MLNPAVKVGGFNVPSFTTAVKDEILATLWDQFPDFKDMDTKIEKVEGDAQ